MKKLKRFQIAAVLITAVVVFTACEEKADIIDASIEGTYIGTLSVGNGLKNVDGLADDGHDALAEVTMMGDGLIEVHCVGEELDTLFMLNYYEYNDSLMVCLTDDDFTNMYGHSLGQGHMSGGMMGDRGRGETEWMHHMDDEHLESDEHFGGFDIGNQSFGYSFMMMENNLPYYLNFEGKKK